MSFDPISKEIQEFNGLYQSLMEEKPPAPDASPRIVEAKISTLKQLHVKVQQLSTDIPTLYGSQHNGFSIFQENVKSIDELWKTHLNSWQEVRSTNFSKTYQELATTAHKGSLVNYPVIVRLNQLKADLETALNDEGISDDQINYIRDLQAQIDQTLGTERQKPQPQAPGLGDIIPNIFFSIANNLDPMSVNALACSNKHLNALAKDYRTPVPLSQEEISLEREVFGLERAARKSLFFQKLTRSQSLSCMGGQHKTPLVNLRNDQVIFSHYEYTKRSFVIWDLLTNSSIKINGFEGCQDIGLTDDALFFFYNKFLQGTYIPCMQVWDIKHNRFEEEKNVRVHFENPNNISVIFRKLRIYGDTAFILPEPLATLFDSEEMPLVIHDLKSNTSRTLWFNFNEIKDCIMKDNLVLLITDTHLYHFNINEEVPSLQSVKLSIELREANFTMEVKTDCILLFTIQKGQPFVLSIDRKSGTVSEIQNFSKEFQGTPLYFSQEGMVSMEIREGAIIKSHKENHLNFYPYITSTSTIVKNLRFLMETASNLPENFNLRSLEKRFPDCIDDMIAALTEIEASANASKITDDQKVEQAIYRFVLKEVVSALEAGYTKEALACFETLPEAIRKDVYEKLYWIIKSDLKRDYWGVGEDVFLRRNHQDTRNIHRIQALQMHLAPQIKKQ